MIADLEAAVREVLDGLPEADRETLHAAFWDEHGGGPAFRKRKERALSRLRQAFRRVYAG